MKTPTLNSLNLMIVGRQGSGKTAFAHTLYKYLKADPDVEEQGHLKIYSGPVTYNKDRTNLTVVDTTGFTFHPNDKQDLAIMTDVLKYIEKQYEIQLMEELKVKRNPRSSQKNTLVDCILYVLSPMQDMLGGDIEVMKRLCLVSNVIPILSHADSMSSEVREAWKTTISQKLTTENIPIFSFMDPEEGELFEEDKEMQKLVPFLVCNTDEHEDDSFLGKKFPWGDLNIENPAHTNMVHLVHCLFVTCYYALKNITKLHYYEKYRTHKLLSRHQQVEQSFNGSDATNSSEKQIPRKSVMDLPGLDHKLDPDRVYSVHSFYQSLQ